MSERERRDPDVAEDLEFDFFDDSPTREAPPAEPAEPRRRPRIPQRPPADGGRGILRLVVLIGAAILLAIILVLWVNSCREGQKRAEYSDYMEAVAAIGGESGQIGKDLGKLITTPGIRLGDLEAGLDGLRQQQAQTVARAQELSPPGPLREQHESLVEALQFRVSGLNGLTEAFSQIEQSTDAQAAGRDLAEQAVRLVASDAIYEDLFKAGSQEVLEAEEVSGVAVPDSRFVQNAELGSPRSWSLVVDRLTQSPTAGGLHGNMIAGVRVQPGAQTLSPTEDNTVTASDRLAFQVLVQNSGDNQETQVPVTLTIQQSPQPITKRQTIDLIDPGETKVVTFRDLGQVSFSTRTTLKVNVEPVASESNTANNTAQYSVIFTLG